MPGKGIVGNVVCAHAALALTVNVFFKCCSTNIHGEEKLSSLTSVIKKIRKKTPINTYIDQFNLSYTVLHDDENGLKTVNLKTNTKKIHHYFNFY